MSWEKAEDRRRFAAVCVQGRIQRAPTDAKFYNSMAAQLPFFAELKNLDIFSEVLDVLNFETFEENTYVFIKGQRADKLYIIIEGELEVKSEGRKDIIKKLGPGDHFGDSGLIHYKFRAASIYCVTAAKLLSLDRKNYEKYCINSAYKKLREKINVLRKCHLLSNNLIESNKNSEYFSEIVFQSGKVIFEEGEPIENLFVLIEGTITLSKIHHIRNSQTSLLSKKVMEASFGFISGYIEMINNSDSFSYTVKSGSTPTKGYLIKKSPFMTLMHENNPLRKTLNTNFIHLAQKLVENEKNYNNFVYIKPQNAENIKFIDNSKLLHKELALSSKPPVYVKMPNILPQKLRNKEGKLRNSEDVVMDIFNLDNKVLNATTENPTAQIYTKKLEKRPDRFFLTINNLAKEICTLNSKERGSSLCHIFKTLKS